MSKGKVLFALGIFLGVLAGGWFLSNYLVLLLLDLRNAPLTWNTWWQYLQAANLPQYAPYAAKINLSGAIGFGVPLLGWFALLIPLFRAKAESLHGDASFAELSDLKKTGLLEQTPQSILIGKYKGRYLWLGGAQHVITVSPTRSGKTTSIAIPVLLSYMHSMVVLDLKGELRKATSGWRQAQGHTIYVWAPYDDQGKTHRFNAFTLLVGKDFYDSQPFRMGDFIDRTGTPPNSSYTLKPGLTVDKNMHMETSKENVEAMGKYYFDKKLMPPNGLGPKANQNYHNYYGEWALNYVDITEKAAQAAHKSDPKYVPPKVEVDLQKIGLDKAQLDTHLNYADTSLGKARPIVEGVNTSGRNGSSLGNAGFGLDDPRNAQNPNHALYGQLKERIPDASEQRLLQFTAACHSSKITGKNLGVIHFDRADGNMIFGATWPPGPSTSVDLKIPSPEPQQSIQEIKQNDQQQAQTRTDIQAQIAQQNNAQGQQGPAMVGP